MSALRRILLCFAAVAVGTAAGCTTDFTGEKGNIQFKYEASGYSFGERAPLAVGAELEVRGAPAGSTVAADAGDVSPGADTGADASEPSLEFTSVESTDPSVIRVVETSGATLTLSGEKSGRVTIEVEATAGGSSLTDAFQIEAGEVSSVTMSHRCQTEGELEAEEIAYFAGQKAHVRYQMSNADGPLAGYGAYPVAVKGATEVAVDSDYERVGFLQFETGSETGTAELDPAVEGEALSVEVVDVADAESFVWPQRENSSDGSFRDVPVDGVRYVHPRFEVGAATVCQPAPALEITNQSTEICDVSVTETFDEGDGDPYSLVYGAYKAIQIRGKKAGRCQFDVELPVASADVTDSIQVRVD